MRSLTRTVALSLWGFVALAQFQYNAPPGPWDTILDSIGVRPGAPAGVANLRIVVGASEADGIEPASERLTVRRIRDRHRPQQEIFWNPPATIARYRLPDNAQVFAWEHRTQAPVLAGWTASAGPVLWLAADPGPRGYERYPYLLQALAQLGVESPVRANQLWAFFDSSYRLRADLDLLAQRWAESGISAIHAAAWHYWEPDAERDAWLARLIETCHRHAIHVYAWIEFPHVSETFWARHPEWREKTALLGDAHLDWRKLMNLQNPDCSREVAAGLHSLAARFDWDGINLGELYFESLEGYANPARFTPFNDDVRREFQRAAGFDPVLLFQDSAPNTTGLRKFLDFRATLARRMQEEWLGVLSDLRARRPQLDLVLTHIDDRFDTQMRDLLGADAAAVLPQLDRQDFTFLVEDPATIWHLGPARYPEIARRYRPLTKRQERLAIDLNIVERYQDVYPTKQQTGVELFQLVNLASKSFGRVALYFENSILAPDLPLLASAAAVFHRIERSGDTLIVDAPRDVSVRWKGPARLDGKPWPLYDGVWVRVPAGLHRVSSGEPGFSISRFNGKLLRVTERSGGFEVEYESRARGIAVVNGESRMLPAGKHVVYFAATS